MCAGRVRKRATLIIPKVGIDLILANGSSFHPLETGGILMGRTRSRTTVVRALIGPGPEAEHRRYSFSPDHEWQTQAVADVYASFKRAIDYLGDWHTHPGGTTRPSERDKDVAFSIAAHPAARAPRPLMLICALNENATFEIQPYVLGRGRLRRADLEIAAGALETVF